MSTTETPTTVGTPPDEPSTPSTRDRSRNLRPILWRLHFLGGFLAAPIVVSLAVTGILFAWNPQIDDVRLGDTLVPSSASVNVSLADQVAAAQATNPDAAVFSVTPGDADTNTAVLLDPPGGETGRFGPPDGINVYVDQATGEVTGQVGPGEDAGSILRAWHSSWSIGGTAEPLTELAGSWFLVSLATGVYLWWPALRKRGRKAFVPRMKARGRTRSKDLHNVIGLALLVPMAALVITGLTWTEHAGYRFDQFKELAGIEQTVPPASPALASAVPGSSDIGNVDAAHQVGVDQGLAAPITVTPPADDATAWSVSSGDSVYPLERDTLLVEPTSGEVVGANRWADQPLYDRLRTGGILFHEASLFGVPGQVGMTILALGVLALIWYGYKMWWQRRPDGATGVPKGVSSLWRETPWSILVVGAVTLWLLPVLGISFVIFLAAEAVVGRVLRRRADLESADTA